MRHWVVWAGGATLVQIVHGTRDVIRVLFYVGLKGRNELVRGPDAKNLERSNF